MDNHGYIHLAIVPDGNRRWAKKNRKSIKEGHQAGIDKLKKLVRWCKDFKVSTLSVWILSTENMKRSKEEIEDLFDLFEKMLDQLLSSKDFEEVRKEVKIKFIGDISIFPESIKKKIKEIESKTYENSKYTLVICANYGGRKEIIDAVNKIIVDAKNGKISHINDEEFRKYLYAPEISEPDLIFRSGGEKRISGFMPWQSVYSEFYFSNKLWPDIEKRDIYKAIEDFKKRQRRFGK